MCKLSIACSLATAAIQVQAGRQAINSAQTRPCKEEMMLLQVKKQRGQQASLRVQTREELPVKEILDLDECDTE